MVCDRLTACVIVMSLAWPLGCGVKLKNGEELSDPIGFDEVRVVSVAPAVDDGTGTLVRQCGAGPVDGYLIDLALLSVPRSDGDNDRSLRPADLAEPLDSTDFGVTVECIDPLPDADGSVGCQGASDGSAQLEAAAYVAQTDDRSVGHDLIILVDMSGSTKGFVDESTGRENAPAATVDFPTNLQSVASDYNSVRLAAVGHIVSELNSEDRVGVVAFGEGLDGEPLLTACALSAADGVPWEQGLDNCFVTSERDAWKAGLADLQNASKPGRSNLWQAVQGASDFLRSKGSERSKHVLVVSDGPDTCQQGLDRGACQAPCPYDVSFQDVLDGFAAASGPDVHVHVVQFESEGYPGPDPRQMEIACRTGGTYQFINGNTLARINIDAFSLALRKAVENVRYSLMGSWRLASRSTAFGDAETPAGAIHKLQGAATLKGLKGLLSTDEITLFTGGAAGQWDQRLTIRKACSGASDCGGADSGDSCSVVCSPETLTCPNGADGASMRDGVSCPDGGGVCCGGSCETSCAACDG